MTIEKDWYKENKKKFKKKSKLKKQLVEKR